jgi:hypothetical protein
MSCNLTTGFNRVCKSGLGGVDKVWVFTYVKYSRSQLVRTGLTLTEFPATVVYEFEPLEGMNAEQKMTKEEGSKFYEQSISLRFSKPQNPVKLMQLIKKDVRIIIKDNNGLYRMLGAYNGLFCESANFSTGGAKSDLNGIEFSFTGKEREEALFLGELLIPDIELPEYLLLESGTDLLLEDNQNLELE